MTLKSGTTLSRRGILLAGTGVVVSGLTPSALDAQEATAGANDLIFRSADPRNAEPDLATLIESWMTPTRHFYVRSHAPNPKIDPDAFQLRVEGLVRHPRTFSLAELMAMKNQTVTATMTCAGNRRAEFNLEGKIPGVQWEAGAIGNATWTGVALSDVLKQVETLPEAKHVWFEGLDQIQRDDAIIPFGGSIPMEKVFLGGSIPGALLVHKMNGQALTPDHGFPLRTVVPGYIGARSVKWLGRIVVSDRPSPNHYQATAYKIVRQTEAIDWTESGPIYRYPINAAIAKPSPQATVPPGNVRVAGYALPSGRLGSRITKVRVSADGGQSWVEAKRKGKELDYCWQLWDADVRVSPNTESLIVQAEDSRGGFMPRRVPWNAKGYLQNAWYRIPITVQ